MAILHWLLTPLSLPLLLKNTSHITLTTKCPAFSFSLVWLSSPLQFKSIFFPKDCLFRPQPCTAPWDSHSLDPGETAERRTKRTCEIRNLKSRTFLIVCDILWRSSARTLGDERRKREGKGKERRGKGEKEKVAGRGKDRVPMSSRIGPQNCQLAPGWFAYLSHQANGGSIDYCIPMRCSSWGEGALKIKNRPEPQGERCSSLVVNGDLFR